MKGVVFNLLSDMVEEKFGLEVWDQLLMDTGHDGVFVASETYADTCLFSLIGRASEVSGIPSNDLIRAFGEYMFPRFHSDNPEFFSAEMTLKEFLLTVDRVIHVEVRKLHPDANLPPFEYIDQSDSELTMLYKSPRKLCKLAEGLISGAANHFGESYTLDHSRCLHNGDDHCRMHMIIG